MSLELTTQHKFKDAAGFSCEWPEAEANLVFTGYGGLHRTKACQGYRLHSLNLYPAFAPWLYEDPAWIAGDLSAAEAGSRDTVPK